MSFLGIFAVCAMGGLLAYFGLRVALTSTLVPSQTTTPQTRLSDAKQAVMKAREALLAKSKVIAGLERSLAGSKADLATLNVTLENSHQLGVFEDKLRELLERIVEEESEIKEKSATLIRERAAYEANQLAVNEFVKKVELIEREIEESAHQIGMSDFQTQSSKAIEQLETQRDNLQQRAAESKGQAASFAFDPDAAYKKALHDDEVERRLQELRNK